jgi:hypothetical protein
MITEKGLLIDPFSFAYEQHFSYLVRLKFEVIWMKRLFLLGVIIVIFSLISCTSLEDNNNASEMNTYEGFIKPISIEKRDSDEKIVEGFPNQLKGSNEDEALRVSILAEIDPDKINYKTNIVFSNKTGKSLDLVFDCGLLISNDKLASNTGTCPAVESMLLKKNNKEKQTIILPKEFFDIDSKLITVRYRQDKLMKHLEVQLQGVKAVNVVTQSVEASDFVLEVTTPTVIRNGETLKVKGILKYIGDENVKFSHGGPIIRFSFTGSNESRAYKDMGYVTELKPGQTFTVEDEFKVTKTGKQKLTVRTTTLDVNDALIEGVGNEMYLKENMVGHNLEIEKSRLSMHPIEIQVLDKIAKR